MSDEKTTKCAHCGTERPIAELKSGTIIFQNSRVDSMGKWKKFVDRKTNLYCIDKPCHGHDQMAHEG